MFKKLLIKRGLLEDPKKAIERFLAEIDASEKANIPFTSKKVKKKAPVKKAPVKKTPAKKKAKKAK